MASDRPIIQVRSVTKRFGAAVTAVDDVSLDIDSNEFFALLGPSGCGKTTLLRMLAGFEVPTAGAILLDGQDITGAPPNKRPVNMVFQSYAVFPHMTVGENVAYGLRVGGMPRRQTGPLVREALDMVKLSHLVDRRPDQLSGGQRQRVALARALVKHPKVLLLDEPLSALDRKLREEMQLELVRLRREVGITFVFVTHDQEEAMSMSSRIGVMDAGRIVQIGAPNEIYEHPRTRFVADFIGSINLIEGHVAAVDGHRVTLEPMAAGIRLTADEDPVTVAVPPAVGRHAWLGVRPEKLTVAGRNAANGKDNSLVGRVLEIAYRGESSMVHVEIAGGAVMRAALPNERRFGGPALSSGDEVCVTWAPASSILLTS